MHGFVRNSCSFLVPLNVCARSKPLMGVNRITSAILQPCRLAIPIWHVQQPSAHAFFSLAGEIRLCTEIECIVFKICTLAVAHVCTYGSFGSNVRENTGSEIHVLHQKSMNLPEVPAVLDQKSMKLPECQAVLAQRPLKLAEVPVALFQRTMKYLTFLQFHYLGLREPWGFSGESSTAILAEALSRQLAKC